MRTAYLACRSNVGEIRQRVTSLGWRAAPAPPASQWHSLPLDETDLLIAELPREGWRDCLASARALIRRKPNLRAVFLSAEYPAGYTEAALDGDEAIPIVRLPCPAGVLEQSVSAAG